MGNPVFSSEGTLMDESGNVIAPSISAQQTIALWASPKSSVGVWTADFGTLAAFNLSDGTQHKSASFDFVCGAGIYTLDFIHLLGPNRGIYTIDIDGTVIATVDGYAAFFNTFSSTGLAVPNLTTITGIQLAAAAHILTFTMADKNASSSAYYGCVSSAVFTRTSG